MQLKRFIKLFIIAFSIFPFIAWGQEHIRTCADLHNGAFYFYPKNSPDRYISYVGDGFEKDVDVMTGDTTLWQVDWKDDCTSKSQFISSSDKYSEKDKKVLLKHKVIGKTLTITPDYFIFANYLEGVSKLPLAQDTMWFHEKIDSSGTQIYSRITDSSNTYISDTSKYSLLYIYRPGRTMRIFDRYPIYINDVFMCEAKNKIGYLFKIHKEGTYTFKNRIYYNADSVSVDIKFGKTYYVRSLELNPIKFREDKFNLKMELVDPETGQTEFNNVKFQNGTVY